MSDDEVFDNVQEKFNKIYENEESKPGSTDDHNSETQTESGSDSDSVEDEHTDKNEDNTEEENTEDALKTADKQTEPVKIKDAWPNHSYYLKPELADEVTSTYKKLDWQLSDEYGYEIRKTRHYYPLLVELGLEALDDLELDEIKERIDDIEPEVGYFK